MPDIKDRILTDAKSLKERYADRMELVEPNLEDLPKGLCHYSVQIKQLHDYIPINYISAGDDLFTSLRKGDFAKLLKRIKFIEDKDYSATDLAVLFLLIEFPTRDRRLAEKIDDVPLPPEKDDLKLKLSTILSPPSLKSYAKLVECSFYCVNNRANGLEKFNVRVTANYEVECESMEAMSFV